MDRGKVCAGKTRDNLDVLLGFLNKMKPGLFKSMNRYEYILTNSYDGVIFKTGEDKRTEPYIREIKSEKNIKRLSEELRECEIIVAMGNCAKAAVKTLKKLELLNEDTVIVESRHLGLQSLNRWKEGKGKSLEGKLSVLAKKICEDLRDR